MCNHLYSEGCILLLSPALKNEIYQILPILSLLKTLILVKSTVVLFIYIILMSIFLSSFFLFFLFPSPISSPCLPPSVRDHNGDEFRSCLERAQSWGSGVAWTFFVSQFFPKTSISLTFWFSFYSTDIPFSLHRWSLHLVLTLHVAVSQHPICRPRSFIFVNSRDDLIQAVWMNSGSGCGSWI